MPLPALGKFLKQCTFFRTFEFDNCGSKQFGPPLMESDWYKLVGLLIEIMLADEVREMVKLSGKQMLASGSMAYLEQDSFHFVGRRRLLNLSLPGQRVDREEVWVEWVEDEVDRKEVISVMNGLSKTFSESATRMTVRTCR